MNPSSERRSQLDASAMAVMVVCSLIWGLGQVAAKVGLQNFSPLMQAGSRSLGAALLLGAWSIWRGVPLFKADGSWRGGLLAGSLFAAEFACIFFGLQYTTASRLTVFLYTTPFFVAMGMPFISRSERLSMPQKLGLVIAFLGVGLAFFDRLSAGSDNPLRWVGDALGLAGAVMWALTTLTIRSTRLSSLPGEKVLFYQLGVCGVSLTAAALLRGESWPSHLDVWPAVSWLFQTVIVAFASFLIWFKLIGRYAATKLATFTLLTPVAGLFFGVMLLGEAWNWQLLVALTGVVIGIAMVNRPRA